MRKHHEVLTKFFGGATVFELGKQFKQLDIDGSDSLTWDELLGGAGVAALFAEVDTDGSGAVSRAELKAKLQSDTELQSMMEQANLNPQYYVFEQLDANQDGQITPSELMEALRAAPPHPRVEAAQQDASNASVLKAALETAEGKAAFKQLFDSLDANKDGAVSSKEWGKGVGKNRELMQKYFGGSTTGEVARMFGKINTDGDAKLTWVEWCAAVGVDPGDEAFDFALEESSASEVPASASESDAQEWEVPEHLFLSEQERAARMMQRVIRGRKARQERNAARWRATPCQTAEGDLRRQRPPPPRADGGLGGAKRRQVGSVRRHLVPPPREPRRLRRPRLAGAAADAHRGLPEAVHDEGDGRGAGARDDHRPLRPLLPATTDGTRARARQAPRRRRRLGDGGARRRVVGPRVDRQAEAADRDRAPLRAAAPAAVAARADPSKGHGIPRRRRRRRRLRSGGPRLLHRRVRRARQAACGAEGRVAARCDGVRRHAGDGRGRAARGAVQRA